jgi:hypothetical protein
VVVAALNLKETSSELRRSWDADAPHHRATEADSVPADEMEERPPRWAARP